MIAMTTIRGWGEFPSMVEEMAGERALRKILHQHDLPVSALEAQDCRIPLAKMMRIFEAAARTVGDQEFGVALGRRTTAGHYGPWAGFAYCAPTLGEALKRVCSTLWAHESGSKMYLTQHPDHVVWAYESGLARYENVRHFSDHLFETMYVFFRGFLGADWRPDWVEVDYAKPAQTDKLEASLGTEIRFEKPSYGVAVRKQDLTAKLSGQLPFPRPITSLDLVPKPQSTKAESVQELLAFIDLRLLDGDVDLDGLARALGLGPRTLQRRLIRLGCTYKELLESVRLKRARAYLAESELPIKMIAADLGYGEQQNFTRAFRAWQGISPSEFRSSACSTNATAQHAQSIVAK